MKKVLALIVLLTIMALVALTGCQMVGDTDNDGTETSYDEAASVFTVDINPGVRFYLASDQTVIEVEATNEDAEAIVDELELENLDYEVALEEVIDEAIEQGYVTDEEPSVLITVEKDDTADESDTTAEDSIESDSETAEDTDSAEEPAEEDFSDKITKKLNKALGKHGKRARVIAQKLEKDAREAVRDMAEKHGISEGKANVIDKIMGEFPELDEDELADLDMGKLGLLLGETEQTVQKHFEKIEKAVDDLFIDKAAALENALASIGTEELAVTEDDVLDVEVRLSREDGAMIYAVRFVYLEKLYEIKVDAELGTVLETEIEELVEFDVDEEIDKFLDERGDFFDNMLDKIEKETEEALDHWREECDKYKEEIKDAFFGHGDEDHSDKEHGAQPPESDGKNIEPEKNEPIGRTEAIKAALELLGAERDDVVKSYVKVHRGKNGILVSVSIELKNHDKYEIVLEAYTASVIKATKNGEAFEFSASEDAGVTEDTDAGDNAEDVSDDTAVDGVSE